jgi:hypothetical protein
MNDLIPWCFPDNCPALICGGPHWSHQCPKTWHEGSAKVVMHIKNDRCSFCGQTRGG